MCPLLLLIIWFIIFFSFSILMSKHIINLADRHASRESIVSGQLVDSITNNNTIRIFAKKDYEASRMEKFFDATKKAFQSKEIFLIAVYCIQGIMIAIMMAFAGYFLVNLYLKNSNGEFSASRTESNWESASLKFDRIGGRTVTPVNLGFDGKISNFQAWDSVLLPSEINTLYNNGQPLITGTQPQAANLQAWYKLNQYDSYWDLGGNGKWTFDNAAIN